MRGNGREWNNDYLAKPKKKKIRWIFEIYGDLRFSHSTCSCIFRTLSLDFGFRAILTKMRVLSCKFFLFFYVCVRSQLVISKTRKKTAKTDFCWANLCAPHMSTAHFGPKKKKKINKIKIEIILFQLVTILCSIQLFLVYCSQLKEKENHWQGKQNRCFVWLVRCVSQYMLNLTG